MHQNSNSADIDGPPNADDDDAPSAVAPADAACEGQEACAPEAAKEEARGTRVEALRVLDCAGSAPRLTAAGVGGAETYVPITFSQEGVGRALRARARKNYSLMDG